MNGTTHLFFSLDYYLLHTRAVICLFHLEGEGNPDLKRAYFVLCFQGGDEQNGNVKSTDGKALFAIQLYFFQIYLSPSLYLIPSGHFGIEYILHIHSTHFFFVLKKKKHIRCLNNGMLRPFAYREKIYICRSPPFSCFFALISCFVISRIIHISNS